MIGQHSQGFLEHHQAASVVDLEVRVRFAQEVFDGFGLDFVEDWLVDGILIRNVLS